MTPYNYGKWTVYWDDRRFELERWRHPALRQPHQFPFLWTKGHVIMPSGYSWDWYQHGKAMVGLERTRLQKEYDARLQE